MLGPGCQQPPSWSARSCRRRARQLHRADALVAEPLAAVAQVLAVVVLGDRQQAAGRALDRVAHRVVAEDVAKAGLLLEHRAGQRDGEAARAWPRARRRPRSARRRRGSRARGRRRRRARHRRRHPSRCRRARGRSDGAGAGRRRRRRPGRARAPRACAAAWPRRRAGRCARCATGSRPSTRHTRPKASAVCSPHSPSTSRRSCDPRPGQMRVQTRLQVGDVGPQPPHFIELPHGRIRASRARFGARGLRDVWRFCTARTTPGSVRERRLVDRPGHQRSVDGPEAVQKLPKAAVRQQSAIIRRAAYADQGALAS